MESPEKKPAFLIPGALFLGVLVSFALCCLGGWISTHDNIYRKFQRFHLPLTPESLFYPTPSQLRELGRSRATSGKVLVVIGGSSILQGTGQTGAELWSDKLQSLLGEQYAVVNFGMRAANATEFGTVAAEVLSRHVEKLLLVVDVVPGIFWDQPDGNMYRYFFWNAYHKGLLLPHPLRDKRLAEWKQAPDNNPAPISRSAVVVAPKTLGGDRAEIRRGSWLDGFLYFDDFWNTFAYRHFVTAWNAHAAVRGHPFGARRFFKDKDPGSPRFEKRYLTLYDYCMNALKGTASRGVKQTNGNLVEDTDSSVWRDFQAAASAAFPERARPRTMVVIDRNSAYYIDKSPPEVQKGIKVAGDITVRKLEELGFSGLQIGEGYQPEDYADFAHLTESGGSKTAELVARKVQEMARKLGYLQ